MLRSVRCVCFEPHKLSTVAATAEALLSADVEARIMSVSVQQKEAAEAQAVAAPHCSAYRSHQLCNCKECNAQVFKKRF